MAEGAATRSARPSMQARRTRLPELTGILRTAQVAAAAGEDPVRVPVARQVTVKRQATMAEVEEEEELEVRALEQHMQPLAARAAEASLLVTYYTASRSMKLLGKLKINKGCKMKVNQSQQ